MTKSARRKIVVRIKALPAGVKSVSVYLNGKLDVQQTYGTDPTGPPVAKWLRFHQEPSTGKTEIWTVYPKPSGGRLGQVKWYSAWRRYSFFASTDTVFEAQCLKDLAAFLEYLMAKRKGERKG